MLWSTLCGVGHGQPVKCAGEKYEIYTLESNRKKKMTKKNTSEGRRSIVYFRAQEYWNYPIVVVEMVVASNENESM